MEDRFQTLCRQLIEFAEILRGTDAGEAAGMDTGAASPHLELLDFDRLENLLRETSSICELAERQTADLGAVRQWLTARIMSLRRGHRVIAGDTSASGAGESLDEIHIQGLMRMFEDEAARLRQMASHPGPAGVERLHISADQYRYYRT